MKKCLVLLLLCYTTALASPPELLPVPDVRQSRSYTCGAAALQAVLAYWGHDTREDRLVKKLGSDPKVGTPPEAIERVAREYGLKVEVREHLTLEDLGALLEREIPVIVAGQAWRETSDGSWSQEWLCGHYMVVVGLDAENVYFEDPSLLGSQGYISRSEFLERWHDMDGSGRKYTRLGLILEGDRPAPPPRLLPVE